ncbi:MAG: 4'-phosphopantetheinyl transferase superfamily protein [Gemmatimonadetes bacterium]|nr:4'-phosphopantetheinyl transferase superfamily protein [Gemmatimonadota bacterium]
MDPRALPGVAICVRALPPGEEQSPFAHAVLDGIRGEYPFTSISHSGHLIAAAAADRPVGIDVEATKPGRPWRAIAIRTWGSEPASEKEFYELWTLHEALFKARGEGLSSANCQLPTWIVTPLQTPPDYKGTLVVEKS